jgi:hypothetical protein
MARFRRQVKSDARHGDIHPLLKIGIMVFFFAAMFILVGYVVAVR